MKKRIVIGAYNSKPEYNSSITHFYTSIFDEIKNQKKFKMDVYINQNTNKIKFLNLNSKLDVVDHLPTSNFEFQCSISYNTEEELKEEKNTIIREYTSILKLKKLLLKCSIQHRLLLKHTYL